MNFKPGDFLFGIIDFFAFLIPGMVFILTIPGIGEKNIFDSCKYLIVNSTQKYNLPIEINLFSFIMLSYIAGHFIHYFSAMAFSWINTKTYQKYKYHEYKSFIDDAKNIIETKIPLQSKHLRAADAYIRVNKPELIPQIEKHEGTSKLFRSLALLFIYLCFRYPELPMIVKVGFIVFAILSFNRFAQQKWRRELLTYEYFVMLP